MPLGGPYRGRILGSPLVGRWEVHQCHVTTQVGSAAFNLLIILAAKPHLFDTPGLVGKGDLVGGAVMGGWPGMYCSHSKR